MTRPTDPRRNARRGSSYASEAGYALAVEHDQPPVNRGKRGWRDVQGAGLRASLGTGP